MPILQKRNSAGDVTTVEAVLTDHPFIVQAPASKTASTASSSTSIGGKSKSGDVGPKTCKCLFGLHVKKSAWAYYVLGAAVKGHDKCVGNLLESRFDLTTDLADLHHVFERVASRHHCSARVLELLLDYGADVNQICNKNGTALWWAMKYHSCREPDRLEVARRLLARGADPCINVQAPRDSPLFGVRSVEAAKLLVENGVSVNIQADDGRTPLSCYVGRDEYDIVKYLLGKGADQTLHSERYGSLLHSTVFQGNAQLVELLVAHGADLEALDTCRSYPPTPGDRTSLMVAARYNDVRIVNTLLEYGAEVEARDGEGLTPLHFVVKHRFVHISAKARKARATKALLKELQADYVDKKYRYQFATIRLLIRYGANLDGLDDHGRTPLTYAIQDHDELLVKELLRHGARDPGRGEEDVLYDINNDAAMAFQRYPRLQSRLRKFRGIVRFVIVAARYCHSARGDDCVAMDTESLRSEPRQPKDIKDIRQAWKSGLLGFRPNAGLKGQRKKQKSKQEKLRTSLLPILAEQPFAKAFAASGSGKVKEVAAICSCLKGCNVSKAKWEKCVHRAIAKTHLACVRSLLESQFDPAEDLESLQCDFFFKAASSNPPPREIMELLLDYGADVNELMDQGTALYYALCDRDEDTWSDRAEDDNVSLVSMLLARGADPTICGIPTHLPLFHVNNVEVARLLVEHGADVNVVGEERELPLFRLFDFGNFEVTKYFLEQGANPNMCQQRGASLLYKSIITGAERFLDLYLLHGADVEQVSELVTPLLAAAEMSSVEMMRTLLDRGADPRVEESKRVMSGYAALHWLVIGGEEALLEEHSSPDFLEKTRPLKSACIKLLVEHGANPDAVDHHGQTPLTYALNSNDHVMVQELLKHGARDAGRDTLNILQECKSAAAAAFHNHFRLERFRRKFRGIARFVIIARRYREAFYKHKYVRVGEQSFNGHRKQLEANENLQDQAN